MRGVDTDMEPREGYKPAKSKEGLNPHVKRHAIIWAIMAAICLPVCAYLLDQSMYLDPADPTLNQIRYEVIKITGTIVSMFLLSGFVIFMECVTNGNLIGRAIATSHGAAIFASSLVIAVALILVFI